MCVDVRLGIYKCLATEKKIAFIPSTIVFIFQIHWLTKKIKMKKKSLGNNIRKHHIFSYLFIYFLMMDFKVKGCPN